jgi:tetratricopeptide (TPR) repeat protein
MISVFLSHSSKDKPFVRELADALERDGQIKVWLDERDICPGQNIVTRIKEGLKADFVVLILSPDSVESSWVEEEWTDAFWQQTNRRETKLLTVLYRDCTIPGLLQNKNYFDLRTNHPEGFRKIRTFLLTERPTQPERINYLPVRPPLFIGREQQLLDLRERLRTPGALVHVAGIAGKGKTTLALEFAHRYQHDFEAVYWLPCQSGSLASISADLARQLGLKIEGDLTEVVRELKAWCAARRCLLILDNVDDESPGELVPGGAASVLVTTRISNLRFLYFRNPVPLPEFTNEQCFELFRAHIGASEVGRYEADCRLLFERLGHLPVAIAVSAALIRYDVRYTIAGLARNLPADVTSLLGEAIAALAPSPRQLLSAMAACAPEGFYFDLAAGIAGLDEVAALEALRQLIGRSLAEEIDRDARRYRLHAVVRTTVRDENRGKNHAEAIQQRFESWETNWKRCEQELPDFSLALEWALKNTPPSFAQALAYKGYALMHRVGRLAEAHEVCKRMCQFSDDLEDGSWLQAWFGNQALILESWGRLEEALALIKQQESICLELGKKGGLQRSYGNQAVILQAWGRLEEALGLLKKQEAICLELGNKDGLLRSYGNQALILQTWGRLEETLELLNKVEAICLERGNKGDLQRTYGNQALILKTRGRLQDALTLLKKQEEICLELGNRDSLQRSYGNQASILRDLARLEEALVLHKKQEVSCLELGTKASLAHCYWEWGLLERARGNTREEETKLSTALDLFRELAMPRELKAIEAELTTTRRAKSPAASQ